MSLAASYVAILPDTSKFGPTLNRNLAGIDSSKAGESVGQKFGSGLKRIAGVALASLAGASVGQFLTASIAEAREAAKVGKSTETVIATTGGAAKISAQQIGDLANALSTKVGVDDEAIQSGANLLLTFTKVRNEVGAGNDVFNRATTIGLDMSAALGVSIPGATKVLGKALNDPIKGMSALSRVGITFTEQQKAQITAMVKSGNVMGAQKVILAELEGRFKGAGAAAADPADKAKVAWANFQETVGLKLLPILGRLADWFTNTGLPAVETFGAGVGALIGWIDRNRAAVGVLVGTMGALFVVTKAHTAFLAVEAAGGLLKYLATTNLVSAATKAWAAVQWLINIALTANPIGLIIVGIAALVAGIIIAYRNSETFRTIVQAAFAGVKIAFGWIMTAAKAVFNWLKANWPLLLAILGGPLVLAVVLIRKNWDTIKGVFSAAWTGIKAIVLAGVRGVVMSFLDMAGRILDAAAYAFGWIKGIGPKLVAAQKAFRAFRDDVNRSLGGIDSRKITVSATFNTSAGPGYRVSGPRITGALGGPVRGGVPGKDSVPYLLMPDEFIVRRDGSNLTDAMKHFGVPGMAGGGLIPGAAVSSRASISGAVEAQFAKLISASIPGLRTLFERTLSAPSAVGGSTLARVRALLVPGLRVTSTYRTPAQNAATGGAPNSYHMDRANPAVDVAGSTALLDGLYRRALAAGRWRELLWRVAGHYDHVHLADTGGLLNPGDLGLNMGSRPERVLSAQQTDSFERMVTALERGGSQSGGSAVFHLYDADGILLGTMRGVAGDAITAQSRRILQGTRF